MKSYSYQNPDDKFEVFLVKTYDRLHRVCQGSVTVFANALCKLGDLGQHIKNDRRKEK